MNMLEVVTAISAFCAIGTTVVNAVSGYRSNLKKQFASEIHFNQLQKNQELMQSELHELRKLKEENFSELQEIRRVLSQLIGNLRRRGCLSPQGGIHADQDTDILKN